MPPQVIFAFVSGLVLHLT